MISSAVRFAVYERDGGRCLSCGDWFGLSVDHIVPVADGGSDDLENLQMLCGVCNSRKGRRTVSFREEGASLPPNKVKVTLTLDSELVPRVDDAAWLARMSRSGWVEARLEDALTGRGVVGLATVSGNARVEADEVGTSLPSQRSSDPERTSRPVSASEVTPDWKGGRKP